MKVGIVGTGSMGSTHAMGWAETDAEIVGFCAESVPEAEPLAKKYHTKVFEKLDQLLSEADIVDICTPTYLHPTQVRQAAKARKQIICEKPLALDWQSGLEMLRACEEAGVRLLVAQVVRFFPEYAAAKELVDSGQIGKPGTIHLRRCSYRPKKPSNNWFLDEQKSGGILMDLAIHDFDYARWVAGDVRTVYTQKVSSLDPSSPIDFGLTILTHENGTLTHVTCGWAYPPPNFQTGFDINCERGAVHFDSEETMPIHNLIQTDKDAPDVALPGSPLAESPYTSEIKEFYRAICYGDEVRVTGMDGVKAVQIACAARESARTGEPVQIKPLEGVLK
jgi:predicted dehydrogenase